MSDQNWEKGKIIDFTSRREIRDLPKVTATVELPNNELETVIRSAQKRGLTLNGALSRAIRMAEFFDKQLEQGGHFLIEGPEQVVRCLHIK